MKRKAMIWLMVLCCFALLGGCAVQNQQDPKTPLKVLNIGNSYSRDCMHYLTALAALDGYEIDAACLEAENAALRDHANNLAFYAQNYTYWRSGDQGELISRGSAAIRDVLKQDNWDVVILQHNPYASGFATTYNGDLKYLLDYIGAETDAKIYWNMSWTVSGGEKGIFSSELDGYYGGSPARMYNAIVDCLDRYIAGENAVFGAQFHGVIPTGAAIQNLRGTLPHDKELTSNGANLSFDIGRLTASMTLIQTLLPNFDMGKIRPDTVAPFLNTGKLDAGTGAEDLSSYVYEEEHLALAVDAVRSACEHAGIPEKLAVEPAQTSSTADVTLLQAEAPMVTYFPDAAVLSDGSVILGAYENVAHRPMEVKAGGGRLIVWAGGKDGTNEDAREPLLIVDETQMEAWGICEISDRYHLLKSGKFDYQIAVDPRDPNFGIVNADMNGDGTKEEVLLFTFWVYLYSEIGDTIKSKTQLYMCWSTDGGTTWSDPQRILRQNTAKGGIKRGNLASFSDGQILIPCYTSNTAAGLLMEYSVNEGKWILLADNPVPNFAADESEVFNEVSFVAPDPDSDVTYAFCRENGTVLKSKDRGKTWELIGNQEGLIHQPGFAIVDKDRVFTTWALTKRPRNTYGKVFYVNGDWEDTQARLIYESSEQARHDMADPSCVLLADGRILTVSYDTAYRSIVGVYSDLSDPCWAPKS